MSQSDDGCSYLKVLRKSHRRTGDCEILESICSVFTFGSEQNPKMSLIPETDVIVRLTLKDYFEGKMDWKLGTLLTTSQCLVLTRCSDINVIAQLSVVKK